LREEGGRRDWHTAFDPFLNRAFAIDMLLDVRIGREKKEQGGMLKKEGRKKWPSNKSNQ
jgi:hypothetical protein